MQLLLKARSWQLSGKLIVFSFSYWRRTIIRNAATGGKPVKMALKTDRKTATYKIGSKPTKRKTYFQFASLIQPRKSFPRKQASEYHQIDFFSNNWTPNAGEGKTRKKKTQKTKTDLTKKFTKTFKPKNLKDPS